MQAAAATEAEKFHKTVRSLEKKIDGLEGDLAVAEGDAARTGLALLMEKEQTGLETLLSYFRA